jgi:hypothetical protein
MRHISVMGVILILLAGFCPPNLSADAQDIMINRTLPKNQVIRI